LSLPVYQSSSSAAVNTSTLTITKPSGTVEGDLLVAFVSARQRDVSPPAGWTEIAYTSGFSIEAGCWYKVAGASEGSSYNFAVGGSAPRHGSGVIARVSATSATQADVSATTDTGSAASATHTSPSVTTTVANTLLFRYLAGDSEANNTSTPSGHTLAAYVEAASVLSSSCLVYKDQAAAGSTGTASFTLGAADDAVLITVAITPGTLLSVVGLASGAVLGTQVVSFGALAASVGKASGAVLGTNVASLGALAASVGIASGAVLGTNVVSFAALAASVGKASGAVVGPIAMSGALAASVGIASGSVLGNPTATISILAVVGKASGAVVGPITAALGTIPIVVGIASGSSAGEISATGGAGGGGGDPMATGGQLAVRLQISGALIDEDVSGNGNAGRSPVSFPAGTTPPALPYGTADGAFDEHYRAILVFAVSTPQTLDLTALVETFGRAVSFQTIKVLYIRPTSTNPDVFATIGGAGSNAWSAPWSSSVTEAVYAPYGMLKTNAGNGWGISGSSKNLKIDPGLTAQSVEVYIAGIAT